MLQNSYYQPSQLSAIRKPNNNYASNLRKWTAQTSERNLLVAVFQMMLGLPSDIFVLAEGTFRISRDFPEIHHLNKQVLTQQIERLVYIGNMLQLLRGAVHRLKKSSQKILQAFGNGLLIEQIAIETTISNKLKTLHQEEGKIKMNQEELVQSRAHPISLLQISSSLTLERQKLVKINRIISQLPSYQSLNHEDMHRASIFLLNYHFQQCQIEHLTQTEFQLNVPFRQCLKIYLDICKSWISFDQTKLFSYNNCGFFVDLTRAISMDGDRFFEIIKIVRKQLIPELFSKKFVRIVQLGKTVQFIKLYFNEQDLLRFHHFLDIDNEFSQVFNLLESSKAHQSFFDLKKLKKSSRTISQRCVQSTKHYERKIEKTQDNPFNIFDTQPSFLKLRFNQSSGVKQDIQINNQQQSIKIVSNMQLLSSLNQVLQRVALKCKIVLKQNLIKQSIEKALRCIKQFVLLGQGDFTRQFLQRSWSVLERSTDRISRNNVERIIEEAIKVSAIASSYQQIRDFVTFVFLRTQAGTSKGWRAFSLTFKPEKPVNFIFNAQAMHDYQCIGNLLFCLRHCEQILVQFWKQSIKSKSSLVLKTRLTIQRFLASLETYMFSQIETSWNNLLGVFETCDSILALLDANKFFLQELKKVTVQNKPLCNSMLSLVKIVDRIEVIGKRMEEDSFYRADKQIEQVWSWFLSLLDQAKHIPQLADSFDFNFDTTRY